MRILVLDESLEIWGEIRKAFRGSAEQVIGACSLQEFVLAATDHAPIDLKVINLAPPFTAWEAARCLGSIASDGPTLVLLDERAAGGVERLASLPGVDCAIRPGGATALRALLARALAAQRTAGDLSASIARGETSRFPDIVGRSPRIHDVFAKLEKVAPGNANVCIVGESGTGKELIARAIHDLSPRHDRPLVTLDCTAVPEGLMESHLFGHLRGSFTGAVESRDGVFSLAHTGTLFIDEISELPLPLQAKLLRVIQTREFIKVGGSKPVRTDIRLVTASNKDLRRAVEDGSFREDLYYRIAVVMVQVPALRERREDISLLVDHFIRKFAAAHRKRIHDLTPRALDLLVSYPWPGNVRQLENCIEQAVVLCDGETLDVDALSLADAGVSAEADDALTVQRGLTLREVERQYIVRTLRDAGGNRTRAARVLGISLRCLQYKLKEYAEQGVEAPAPRDGRGEPATRHLLGV
jgi:two-component system, NtrC family, response regulator